MNSNLQMPGAGMRRAVVSAMFLFAAIAASAESDDVLTLDVRRQDVGSALVALAETSGVHIMLDGETGEGVEVEGLKGEYRFEDALAALLSGTGLTFAYASANVVLVRPLRVSEADAAVPAEPGGEQGGQGGQKEQPSEVEVVVVTGSRLEGGDPTARVLSLSAEDIAARGVSSLEDLFRTLPWTFPSITTQNNTTATPVGAVDADQSHSIIDGFGLSTVNLRAMGSANTLVLIDGRRVAGQAGEVEGFANLLNIPLAAIERVDIQLDGASAVYGADAIGGVVNFITRKHYAGVSIKGRKEYSSTDAHASSLNLTGGYGWNRGSGTLALSRTTSTPITNAKTGWTSYDYRDQFGPDYDVRSVFEAAQPGIVCRYNGYPPFPGCAWGSPRWQLPSDHDGVGATVDDFTTEIVPADHIIPKNGEDSTNISFNLHLEQDLSERLSVYADVLYSDHQSYREEPTKMDGFLIPASNAHNPFGEPVVVSYWPVREVEAGVIPRAHVRARSEQRNYNAGFAWEMNDDHTLLFNVTHSESERFGQYFEPTWRRLEADPTHERLYAALESSDPNVALNLFGNGSAQGPAFPELLKNAFGTRHGASETTSYEPRLRGRLFRLRGGEARYAVGAQIRIDGYSYFTETLGEDGRTVLSGGLAGRVGASPREKVRAYFAEVSLPIVGPANSRPWVHSLLLSLQARYDSYETDGAHGGENLVREVGSRSYYVPGTGWVPYPAAIYHWEGDPIVIQNKRSNTSPRVALRYQPTDRLSLRVAWSESFRPPVFTEQFDRRDTERAEWYLRDPYSPDGNTGWQPLPVTTQYANPDLKSELSDNYSLGLAWSPTSFPGFRLALDWSRIEFANKIEHSFNLFYTFPEVAFKIPEIAERDADGKITNLNSVYLNLAEKINEIASVELEYSFDTGIGSFLATLSYLRVVEESFRATPESKQVSQLGTISGSNEYKLIGSASWRLDRWRTDLFAHHTPAYLNNNVGNAGRLPPLKVEPLTTIDVALTYRFDIGLRLRVGGRNVFDARSPTISFRMPYDASRWDARGRILFFAMDWEI
ncbi:MAG: TonB-dependent receptor [Gammaproteobacteria bacterium]|nr:TonB-dependent receptor [Gammaproteobacteria bacterium]